MAGVTAQYDENGGVTYYASVPSGTDEDGNTTYRSVPVPTSEVKFETVNIPYDPESGSGGSYQQPTVSSDVYQKAIDAVTPPSVPKTTKHQMQLRKVDFFKMSTHFLAAHFKRFMTLSTQARIK